MVVGGGKVSVSRVHGQAEGHEARAVSLRDASGGAVGEIDGFDRAVLSCWQAWPSAVGCRLDAARVIPAAMVRLDDEALEDAIQ